MSEAFGGLSHLDYPDQTMNSAAADYARLAADNPSAFSKLRRSGNKGSIKTSALEPLAGPTGASAPVAAPAPSGTTPHSGGPKNALPQQSNLTSGPGLIDRIMKLVTAPPPTAAGFMQSQFNPFGQPAAPPGGGQPPQPQGGAPGSMLFGPDFRPPQFGPTPHTPFPPASPSPSASPSQMSPLAGGMVGPNPLANPPPTSLKLPPRPPQTPAAAPPTSLKIPPRPEPTHPALARLQSIINSLPLGSWFAPQGYAEGGVVDLMRGGYPVGYPMGLPTRHYDRGDYVTPDGEGDGRSDHIRANLSPGEFVVDAETVSLLGNGDNEAGARNLEHMRQQVRRQKGRALAKGKFSPDAKGALSYMRRGA